MLHPKKRARLLSEIIGLTIGDLAGRILDEIVHDLTPYGYEDITKKISDNPSITNVYVKTNIGSDYTATTINEDVNESNYNVVNVDSKYELAYTNDVIADIVINHGDKPEAKVLSKKINELLPTECLRKITRESVIDRRLAILKRKTVTRHTKRIIQIIIENKIDMSIKTDVKPDMTVKSDEMERFVLKLKNKE